MEKDHSNALQVIILVICLVNLFVGLAILVKPSQQVSTSPASLSLQPLPKTLQEPETRNALFDDIRIAYNADDVEALWTMLDPMAQSQASEDDLRKQLETIKGLCGTISSGVYSHYESVDTTQGLKQFKVYFLVELEKGKGTFCISIGQQGDEPYRLFGWNLNKTL